MGSALSQLHRAIRSLTRAPGFTALTVLTLAVGIAAVTASGTLLDRVVLRPLPYPEADRLVWIESEVSRVEDQPWGLSVAGYFHFAERASTLERLGAADIIFIDVRVTIEGPDGAVRVSGDSVSASLLEVLGAKPAVGRLIEARDDRPGAPLVTVLSHEIWRSQFGGDSAVVGRTLRVAGLPMEVVGVTEPGFHLPGRPPGVLIPLRMDPGAPPVNDHYMAAIGRLAPGVTLSDAQAELDRLTARLPDALPEAYSPEFMEEWGFRTKVVPLRGHVIGGAGDVLWTLLAGVALVLVIALANAANLFLVRAEVRRGELAVRAALGAGRGRRAAEGLAESVVVGLVAGTLGLGLAVLALEALVAAGPASIPRLPEVGAGWMQAGMALGIGLLAGLVLGPVARLWIRIDLTDLRNGGRGATVSRRRQTARRALVGGQVALALVLLATAGLMIRSFDRLRRVELGFEPENVLTFQVGIPESTYGDFAIAAGFYRRLAERLEALPEVSRAAAVEMLPLRFAGGCWFTVPTDRPWDEDAPPPCPLVLGASPGALEALGVPVRGAAPDWDDVERGTRDVVVTRALADRFWPGQDAIGKTVRGPGWGDAPHYRVSAVAGDIRMEGVDRPATELVLLPIRPAAGMPLHYGPYWGGHRELIMVVRTTTEPSAQLAAAARDIVTDLDPGVAPGRFETLADVVGRSGPMARARLLQALLTLAAAVAVFLAAVGLYGVVSFVVRQRTREIGLRMALGADLRRVTVDVLRQTVTVALVGVGVGLAGALVGTRLLRSLLFQVHPNDPLTLVAAAALLVLVAGVAGYLPARRATRIDPVTALREE
jgi:putative ABC transport system permease protein